MRSADDTRLNLFQACGPGHGARGSLLTWLRVREFAVPPSMIETATARRLAGDWAGACAAARVDVDLHPRAVARTHGVQTAARLRADLRALAPDLLRWHLPRVAPDGLLRPALTVALARYDPPGAPPLYLVARTPPAWADAGQRISLALWARSGQRPGAHPHPRPDRRFRLDLHRHLWDAHRAGDLRHRCRPDVWNAIPAGKHSGSGLHSRPGLWPGSAEVDGLAQAGYAVHRWVEEASILLDADGASAGPVLIRLDAGRRLLFDPETGRPQPLSPGRHATRPVLPDAATRVPPDLELLKAGLIDADRLHPLVAAALATDHADPARHPPGPAPDAGDARPDHPLPPLTLTPDAGHAQPDQAQDPLTLTPNAGHGPPGHTRHPPTLAPAPPDHADAALRSAGPAVRFVDCGGARHRIGVAGGVLAPLDHDPEELRREEMLVAFGGTPMPCLRAVDEIVRSPESLDDVRARLDHGDFAGALAVVEELLGPDALLRSGALREELETAALRRLTHGMFRAGLTGFGPPRHERDVRRRRDLRSRPRQAMNR